MRAFRKTLPAWFREERRDLPWRRLRTPYTVAVSEFMLQQTQVKTVLPYFDRWMKSFPDWKALAIATPEKVLKHWEGLGYYSRARNLHRLAQAVMERPTQQLPSSVPELMELPGIGRYTAGAISSMAFQQSAPLLDGNVIRILTRVFAYGEEVSKPDSQKYLWSVAETLLPPKNVGEFNEALMELGALICSPNNPQCLLCPLRTICQAKNPEDYPVKARAKTESREEIVVLIKNRNRIWVEKGLGRFDGFWRFPFCDEKQMKVGKILDEIIYPFTKYKILLQFHEATWKKTPPKTGRWMTMKELEKVSLPQPHRRLLSRLAEHSKCPQALIINENR